MFLHASAPPSAVVRFLTAWKENDVKSAIAPALTPFFTDPKACAPSEITATLPIAAWSLFAGLNKSFFDSTISNILS